MPRDFFPILSLSFKSAFTCVSVLLSLDIPNMLELIANDQNKLTFCRTCAFFYQNGVEELDKLARFLEVDLTDKLRDEIVEMCSIDKMQKEKPSFIELFKNIGVNNGYSFFRKGIMSLFCWYKLQKDKKISITSHYQFLVHVKKTKTF